ncbi:unnamed protein product [Pleuronectes platessa]|uniref:Uncharacterized protein n=1 Tax=Pleuronectes platessa TaxID=8262 RepID=A0A9N7YD78_PLEPL|nr:unnamed protein product [Pleuronectes platessa]
MKYQERASVSESEQNPTSVPAMSLICYRFSSSAFSSCGPGFPALILFSVSLAVLSVPTLTPCLLPLGWSALKPGAISHPRISFSTCYPSFSTCWSSWSSACLLHSFPCALQ